MARAAFIEIDGKRYLWRDILELRKQQLKDRRRDRTRAPLDATMERRAHRNLHPLRRAPRAAA
jgi:hypothetical protein